MLNFNIFNLLLEGYPPYEKKVFIRKNVDFMFIICITIYTVLFILVQNIFNRCGNFLTHCLRIVNSLSKYKPK